MMGANEDRLRKIAESEPFDLPGIAAMRNSLKSLQATLGTVSNPDSWEGDASVAASQRMSELKKAYVKVDSLLAKLENKVNEANVYRQKAIDSVEALPESKAPGWVHAALDTADILDFPGIGPVDMAQGGVSVIEHFLGNKREAAAQTALEQYSEQLQDPATEMAEVRKEIAARPALKSGTDEIPQGGDSSGGDGSNGGSGGNSGGSSGGSGAGGNGGRTPSVGAVFPVYVAEEPPVFVDPGPPSEPVPDDGGPGYIPGGDGPGTIGGGGAGSGSNGSGGLGGGAGVLGGVGAAGAIAAVKGGAGGLGGLGGTVGKLGTGGLLGAGGYAGKPGAAGGVGVMGTSNGAGAGAAGSRGGTAAGAGASGSRGSSSMHGAMGGASGKDEKKRRTRVGMAGPMAPKLDDDENLGPRAAGTRAGGRDDNADVPDTLELPDSDAE